MSEHETMQTNCASFGMQIQVARESLGFLFLTLKFTNCSFARKCLRNEILITVRLREEIDHYCQAASARFLW
jgi:hypothetical protein